MKKFFLSLVLGLLTVITGAGANVMMAAVTDASGAETGAEGGNTAPAQNQVVGDPNGIATETNGRIADPDFYLNDVDKRIVKVRPMSTPIDQISRYAKTESVDSFVCKYYSSGTRPVKTTLSAAVTAMQSGASTKLTVNDPGMFTIDDTILVPSVAAITNYKGAAYTGTNKPYLELCVCGRDSSDNQPIVYAVNGNILTTGGEPIGVPAIAKDAVVIRMGKAAGELDVQTGRFANRPRAEENYCQNFMIQIEQSTFDKIAAKEVNWDFSDIEEDGIYDMRLAQEFSFLFGDMNVIHHVTKDNMAQWFTKGIWFQAGKDLTIGNGATITQSDLVDFSQDAFDGVDAGNRRVLLAGSDLMAALDKIQTTGNVISKRPITRWHLDFTELSTTFGKIDVIHAPVLNQVGKSAEGFLLDPDFLSKKVHVSWARNVLDLKSAGVRNTDAVVIQEVACLCLRYADAHARVLLG